MRPASTYRAARRNRTRTAARHMGARLGALWALLPRQPAIFSKAHERHTRSAKYLREKKQTPFFADPSQLPAATSNSDQAQ